MPSMLGRKRQQRGGWLAWDSTEPVPATVEEEGTSQEEEAEEVKEEEQYYPRAIRENTHVHANNGMQRTAVGT